MNGFITKIKEYKADDNLTTAISFAICLMSLAFICAVCTAGIITDTNIKVGILPLLSVIMCISGVVFLRNFERM